jgi:hypothetical protein
MKRLACSRDESRGSRDHSGCIFGADGIAFVIGDQANVLGLAERASDLLQDQFGFDDVL